MLEERPNQDNILLTVRGLKTYFPVRGGVFSRVKAYVRAVDGVDLTVRGGKTLGLVGESGSGKTTVGRTILRLIPATAGRVGLLFAATDRTHREKGGKNPRSYREPHWIPLERRPSQDATAAASEAGEASDRTGAESRTSEAPSSGGD